MAQTYQKQWKVPSDDKDSGKVYTVSLTQAGEYQCSCPHWIFRARKRGEACKHIQDVQNGLWDDAQVQDFNFVMAVVKEVTLEDDRCTISIPLRPITDTDFLATVVYDLLMLGVPWRKIREWDTLMPRQWTPKGVIAHIQRYGRKTWKHWVEGHGWCGFEFHTVEG